MVIFLSSGVYLEKVLDLINCKTVAKAVNGRDALGILEICKLPHPGTVASIVVRFMMKAYRKATSALLASSIIMYRNVQIASC